jgi:protein-tyrosine phosphatase
MVDIHSHILWGLDDGAETLEQSLAMMQIAAGSGTTDIVATPHANFRHSFQPALVTARIEEILAASGGHPKVHRGCDFHLSFDNIQDALEHPTKYAINGGRYLLVEFPDTALTGMGAALGALLHAGLIPIMTHPERQPVLRRIPADFEEWIQMGCLVQITAQSLLGRFGRHSEESAWEMVRRGMAHFVASDAHDEKDRTPRLDEAFAAVAARVDQPMARRLFIDNPESVISGGTVSTELPKRASRLRFWK